MTMQTLTRRFVLLGISLLPIHTHASDVPLPEFYGLYAVADGKLHGIDVAVSTLMPPRFPLLVCRTEKELEVGFGAPLELPILPADLQFLTFARDFPLEVARQIELRQLSFVRRMTILADSPQYRKTYETNSWVSATEFGYIGVGEDQVALLQKPLRDEDDMVLSVSSSRLTTGLYRLKSGDTSFLFVVGPVEDLATTKSARCIDAVKGTAFGPWTTRPCETTPAGYADERADDQGLGASRSPNPRDEETDISIAEGVARFPVGATTVKDIVLVFRNAMVDAGYQIESVGLSSVESFKIDEPKNRIVRSLMKGFGPPPRITWGAVASELESGEIDVKMRRTVNVRGHEFIDIIPLFGYVCGKLGVDPDQVFVTTGGHEGSLSSLQ